MVACPAVFENWKRNLEVDAGGGELAAAVAAAAGLDIAAEGDDQADEAEAEELEEPEDSIVACSYCS